MDRVEELCWATTQWVVTEDGYVIAAAVQTDEEVEILPLISAISLDCLEDNERALEELHLRAHKWVAQRGACCLISLYPIHLPLDLAEVPKTETGLAQVLQEIWIENFDPILRVDSTCEYHLSVDESCEMQDDAIPSDLN